MTVIVISYACRSSTVRVDRAGCVMHDEPHACRFYRWCTISCSGRPLKFQDALYAVMAYWEGVHFTSRSSTHPRSHCATLSPLALVFEPQPILMDLVT